MILYRQLNAQAADELGLGGLMLNAGGVMGGVLAGGDGGGVMLPRRRDSEDEDGDDVENFLADTVTEGGTGTGTGGGTTANDTERGGELAPRGDN